MRHPMRNSIRSCLSWLDFRNPDESLVARRVCGIGQAVDPRIEHGHARLHVFGSVARDDRETMMLAGRGDDEIGLREGVPALAPLLDHESPLEHDVFGDREDALLEHRTDFVREPVQEFRRLRASGRPSAAICSCGITPSCSSVSCSWRVNWPSRR